jgi:poly(A) polymerase
MSLFEFSLDCLQKIRHEGFEAYFAGGCVRDRLLKISPLDYDIATSALPADLKKIFPRYVEVGEAFNVIRVLSAKEENPEMVEVASFRKDVGVGDGRHPRSVETATAREDVERRDFTINGLLWDPITDQILDWVGGEKDLQAKLIRAIGNPTQRLQEDYLRMLRAVRFSARFEFPIELSLMTSIQNLAPQIHKISKERIFDEFCRMFSREGANRALELLDETGLLKELIPEALFMKGVEQPPEYHPEGDVWVHTLLLLQQIRSHHSPELGWACLLHDIAKPQTYSKEEGDRIRFNGHASLGAEMSDEILKRFKAPNRFREIVFEMVRDHLKFADVKKMKASTLKRFLRQNRFDWHLELHRIDCMASHEKLELYEFCQDALKNIKEEDLKPSPLLTGKDLIQMGYRPGRDFKEMLTTIETLQLDGVLSTHQEALDYIQQNYPLG